MTLRIPVRRQIAAIAAASAIALALTACTAPNPSDSSPTVSAAGDPSTANTSAASPAPGRTIEATPPADLSNLRGVRIATVVPDDSEATRVLQEAMRVFAEENGLVVEEFVAAGQDAASMDSAFGAARATEPHVVVGLGQGAVDVFAYQSSQWLDHDFLLLGAQAAEPTSNLTAVVWEGATSRGSGAPADGELDDAAVTGQRAAEAVSVGVATVMSGVTGIVLHLPG